MTDHDSIDMYFDDDQWYKKDAYRTQKLFKKARRKFVAALLSVLLIVTLPFFRSRYIDFNSLYSTTLDDFSLFRMFAPQGLRSLLAGVPVFLVLITLVLLFALLMFIKMRRLKNASTSTVFENFKPLYNRFDVLVFVLHLMALYMVVNAFFFSMATIEGASMKPTFNSGDNVVMTHVDESYDRLDLVVVRHEDASEDFLIKRLIGLPGETIMIEDDGVFVDGARLNEPYLAQNTKTTCPRNEDSCSWTLQEDEYFVLGDNRSNSLDSRHYGHFTSIQLYGRIQIRLYPFHAIGKVE